MTETRSDFWSRRKARVEEEAAAEERAEEAAEVARRETELAEKSDEEVLAELNLPDPDSLQMGDDFSVFMKQAVPERIRRRALRKLWLSNPLLANLDSLVEYGEDYTDAATVVENLSTTYQVGKGMLAHVLEMERQQAEADAAAAGDTADPDPAPPESAQTPEEPDAPETPDAETTETLVAIEETPVAVESCTDGEALPPRRRMRFAFAE